MSSLKAVEEAVWLATAAVLGGCEYDPSPLLGIVAYSSKLVYMEGMYIIQMMIVIAVGWTGIYYQWTPNMLLLGILGMAAAYALTVWPLKLYLCLRGLALKHSTRKSGHGGI